MAGLSDIMKDTFGYNLSKQRAFTTIAQANPMFANKVYAQNERRATTGTTAISTIAGILGGVLSGGNPFIAGGASALANLLTQLFYNKQLGTDINVVKALGTGLMSGLGTYGGGAIGGGIGSAIGGGIGAMTPALVGARYGYDRYRGIYY